MVNKILAAFVAVDFLFIVSGAIMLGFSLIVRSNMNEVPTEGRQAARNLIYQSFPFEGKCTCPAGVIERCLGPHHMAGVERMMG